MNMCADRHRYIWLSHVNPHLLHFSTCTFIKDSPIEVLKRSWLILIVLPLPLYTNKWIHIIPLYVRGACMEFSSGDVFDRPFFLSTFRGYRGEFILHSCVSVPIRIFFSCVTRLFLHYFQTWMQNCACMNVCLIYLIVVTVFKKKLPVPCLLIFCLSAGTAESTMCFPSHPLCPFTLNVKLLFSIPFRRFLVQL